MKLITSQKELSDTFISLLNEYKYISFATAWASSKHTAFKSLLENKNKIKKSTIGIHFYQTEPEVLKHFEKNKNIKFVLQSSGVFHPKIYLFWNNDKEWAVLSGSANLTCGAFDMNNTENMFVFKSNECLDNDLFSEIIEFLEDQYTSSDSKFINETYINRYINLYRNQRSTLLESSVFNEEKINSKNILDTEILTYSWDEYLDKIKKDPYHGFDDRLSMLEEIQGWFENDKEFSKLSESERKFIMGLPSDLNDPRYAWFGHLETRWRFQATFRETIQENIDLIGKAIDQIPLNGEITKDDFLIYSNKFYSAFKNKEFSASMRLLSMKRPDLFFCMNGKNEKAILKDLGLNNIKDPEFFWDEVLQKIYTTPWFNSPEPKNPIEKLAWKYRVALIDCIYYEA